MRSGTDRSPAGEGGPPAVLERLVRDGLLRRSGAGYRTTVRWQGAMARAALHLQREAGLIDEVDLRLPIAVALIDLYGRDLSDREIAALVVELLPIEAAELDPRGAAPRGGGAPGAPHPG